LILLYWKGAEGATRDELLGWIVGEAESAMSAQRRNFNTAMGRLDERHQVQDSGQRVFITKEGERAVDGKKLVEPV
jgi:hypothetical protein